MRILALLLLLLATPAYSIQMIGFGGGGGPPGGTVLVGDSTYDGVTYTQLNTNGTSTSEVTAVASGTANTAWIYYYNTDTEVCKVCIYATGETGALLECVSVPRPDAGWQSAAMAGTLSITASTSYRVGAVCNGYVNIGTNTGAYLYVCNGGNYDTPPNPNCHDSNSIEGVLNVYITN
jgi:hypothetical protein